MKMKNLLMKKALRAALFVLLLSVVGMTNLQAQNITFADSTYTTNGMANSDQTSMYRDYSDLPTFEYNGLTYVVAPDPQSSYSSFVSYSAAYSYCENLTLYGYSDWRMPSITELEMMWQNRTTIGGFNNYTYMIYHSSTQNSIYCGHYKLAWVVGERVCESNLEDVGHYTNSNSVTWFCHVRPIRVHVELPTVTTNNVTSITQTHAYCGGNVTNNGGAWVTERGVCWSTSPTPTLSDNHTNDGNNSGSFTSYISNLTPGTQYYVRAYATNSEGTGYGNEVCFTTSSYNVPTVTTNSVYDITTTTAKGGCNVTNNGGHTLTEEGICWSTSPTPTTYNSHISSNYNSLGNYTFTMTGLIPGTQYYVRAYASNSEGTGYGNEVTFTTTSPPTVTTNYVTNITPNSATCGGNVTTEGSGSVTARGVCWSTNPSPTISNSHTNDGTGTGSFTSNMTGLNQGTSYYVRAYATNSEGTAYGEEMYFTTTRLLDVTTNNVTYITQTSAICGGYVTAYNGATVTDRGVCWSTTSQTPTVSDIHTSSGTGLGSFTSNLTGLTQNTTYYVRAYATCSGGTVYGETKQFTTTKFEYRISEGGVVATSAGGYFYDSGGPNNNYGNNEHYIMTFMSNQGAGTKIRMTFVEFGTWDSDDYLVIYDGINTSAPLIGTYYDWDSPGTVTATNSDGALTFVFISNSDYSTFYGWKADISIVTPSYFIDVSANPGNGGTVSGGGYFNYGESCTLTASPATGYTFVRWTKNGAQVSTNPTYNFTVTGSGSYVAHFSQNSYTISASANPSYGGTVTGGGTYNHGANCTLTATANTGYTFVNWTKNGTMVSTSPSYSFTVTEAAMYVANFQQQQSQSYAINVSANPTAGGTVSGGGTYNQGQSCTLTATPATDYTFVKWTKNGTRVSTNATYTFAVTESATYVAHFRPQYTITTTTNPANGGTVSGGGTYVHGQRCTLTAVPATGYTFVKWTKNGMRVSSSPTYTFTVTESATYVAHFRPQYTITATANPTNGGTVSGSGTYVHGQRCTLTAVPAAGYTFVKWTKNGTRVSTNATYTFTVTESATYVAHFRPQNTITITATANPANGGTVSGSGTYNQGQSCTLTATPATGYTFVKWTKNGTRVSTSPTYTFTVTESATYVAHFRPQYTITATTNPTNGGTVSGGGTYVHGQSCTLTATASTGYTFVNWKENGSVVSTNTTYSFTVTGARTLVANFEGNPAPVNITFADANVKALCIANWDTNGDGELNYAEAAAVTDLGTVFKDNDNITTFNELQYFTGLTFIGERAFYNCEGLTSVIIPNSVTTLNQYAFAFCYYLTSVGLPNSLTTIGNYAFESCFRLNSIIIPNTVMTIGNWAFYDCSGLVSLEIPASVTSIGNYAFCYCTGLAQITVAAANGVFDSRNNCNAIIETSTNTLRFGCKNSFIPNTVTALGTNAFLDMDIISVHIPQSVTSIGTKAFGGCSLLEQITVAQNNPVFDSRNNCNAIVETSTNKLVVGCKNTIIPNTITTIGDYAFYNCEGLTSIVVPNSVTTLNQYAFAFCYHLISVGMSNSLTTIGNYAFESCFRLNSINIPNTVVTIGNWAFYDCSGLVSLEIPASVISIGNYSFYDCTKLTHIISWANNPPALGNNVFVGVDKSIPVYVSAGRISIYQAVYGWNEFTNYQEITNNGENIFFADVNVKALCVANWDINGDGELSYSEAAVVTNLGEVFKNNTTIISFNELQYFTGLTTIGEDAFRGCENLSLVTIPNFVNSIGDYAFRGCYDLTSIVIPNSVIVIGNYAFYSCFDLVLVTIGNSVIFIGNYAFSWCSDLSSMSVLAETPPSLSNGAFNYVDKSIPVYVPCGSMAAYQSSAYWNEFTNIQEDCTRLLSEDWNQIGYPVITQESLSTEQTNFVTNRVLSLYPNPTERNTVFTLDIPSEEIIVEVFVCNAFGAVVLHETGVQVGRHMQSIAVSGVYIVKAICKSGNLYVGKLIVK